jgi:hypothetical protein
MKYPTFFKFWRMTVSVICLPFCVLMMFSCSSTGPKSVIRDRNGYVNAISDSWKSQLLLNMVKIRYGDAPMFLDVASVINQYEISGQVHAGASLEQKGVGWIPDVGSQASFTDRPTITYTPFSGPKFALEMMKPIAPKIILNLVGNGFPIDVVLRLTLNSLSGYENSFGGYIRRHPADTEFYTLLGTLRKLQKQNCMYFFEVRDKKGSERLMLETDDHPDKQAIESIEKLNTLLKLPAGNRRFFLDLGARTSDTVQLAMTTRSMIEILSEIAWSIEVPKEHLDARYTYSCAEFKLPDSTALPKFVNILNSKKYPENAFLAVQYDNYWFYIDNSDFYSKQTFTHLLLMTSLSEVGDNKNIPLITVPTK